MISEVLHSDDSFFEVIVMDDGRIDPSFPGFVEVLHFGEDPLLGQLFVQVWVAILLGEALLHYYLLAQEVLQVDDLAQKGLLLPRLARGCSGDICAWLPSWLFPLINL